MGFALVKKTATPILFSFTGYSPMNLPVANLSNEFNYTTFIQYNLMSAC